MVWKERKMNTRKSDFEAGSFWYSVHESTKTNESSRNILLWNNLGSRRILQRHKENNVFGGTFLNISNRFLQTGKEIFSILIFITLLDRSTELVNIHWKDKQQT